MASLTAEKESYDAALEKAREESNALRIEQDELRKAIEKRETSILALKRRWQNVSPRILRTTV